MFFEAIRLLYLADLGKLDSEIQGKYVFGASSVRAMYLYSLTRESSTRKYIVSIEKVHQLFKPEINMIEAAFPFSWESLLPAIKLHRF